MEGGNRHALGLRRRGLLRVKPLNRDGSKHITPVSIANAYANATVYLVFIAFLPEGSMIYSIRPTVTNMLRGANRPLHLDEPSLCRKICKPVCACSAYSGASLLFPGHFVPAAFFNKGTSIPGIYRF